MTTIAYRDGVMAADSGCWVGEAAHRWARKLAKGKDGVLYGVLGYAAPAENFLRWVRSGYFGAQPQPVLGTDNQSDFCVLIAPPAGELRYLTARGEEVFDAPYYAAGAGAEVAFGALFVGANAVTAIRAAMEHASGAFGDVHTIFHDGGA